jgi:phage N-6-adenine-methyltransferase
MAKCPESIEELQALEQLLPLCRKDLYRARLAKIESGAAYSKREAERQLAEETGKPLETIRSAIKYEQRHELGRINPVCEIEKQAAELHDDAFWGDEPICAYCVNYDADKRICWLHREDAYGEDTCDDWRCFPEEERENEKVILATLHTGDHESYTPAKYIEAAREVMGSIDLDPASNDKAQDIIRAATYYTKEDNGLDKPWKGNIFLNPPYSHPEVKYFVDKLLNELKPGQQAILLTNNNTDTNFFHDAAQRAMAICFTKGRINFLKPDGTTSSPTNGQVFYYFGENIEGFVRAFSEFGIMMAVI